MSNKGLFGNLFDFNGDGKLDTFEKAADFEMFMQMIDSKKNNELTSAGLNPVEFVFREQIEKNPVTDMAGFGK